MSSALSGCIFSSFKQGAEILRRRGAMAGICSAGCSLLQCGEVVLHVFNLYFKVKAVCGISADSLIYDLAPNMSRAE